MWKRIAVFGVFVLSASACSGANERTEPSPPIDEDTAPHDVGAPNEPPPPDPTARLFVPPIPASGAASGALITANADTARPEICVAFDSSGRIERIDEATCEPVHVDHMCGDCERYAYCAGCLMFLDELSDGRTLLEARPFADCVTFAGSYQLDLDDACTTSNAREAG